MRPALALSLLGLPVALAATPAAAEVDDGGFAGFFAADDAELRASEGGWFERYDQTLALDHPEFLERRFHLKVRFRGFVESAHIPVAVVDLSLDDRCVLRSELDDPDAEEGDGPLLITQLEDLPREGFAHYGDPRLCVVHLEGTESRDSIEVEVVIQRPRPQTMEALYALRLPVQPPDWPAAQLRMAVEFAREAEPAVLLSRWRTELGRQTLPDRKGRVFFELERVRGLPPVPLHSLAGRLPEVLVTSGEPWDDTALAHRLVYQAASRAKGDVLRLAGRVLARGEPLRMVREAAVIALDELPLDPRGGAGGAWRLPQGVQFTLEDGRGTAADRAALLLALLRTAGLGAEVVMTSSAAAGIDPELPVAVLDRTLVYVPGVSMQGDRPLFIDPSRSSAWLGVLPEELAGRPAFLAAPEGARWLTLPDELPQPTWTLRAVEQPEGDFTIAVSGRLQGPAAARVRAWNAAGRPADAVPAEDLAWLGRWLPHLTPALHEGSSGSLAVSAEGRVPRELALEDGHPAAPALPRPAGAGLPAARVTGAEALRFAGEWRESWRFAQRGVGSPPTVRRISPFWELRSAGSWSGPLLNRETVLRWKGGRLGPNAISEGERYEQELERIRTAVRAL